MNNLMKNVILQMENYLSQSQIEILKSVLKKEFEKEKKQINLSNQEYLENFIKEKTYESCSINTIKMYKYENNKFIQRLNKSVTKVTKNDIEEYLVEYRSKNNISNVTLNNMRRYISAFFAYLENEDIIKCNPVRKTKPIKELKDVKVPFTELEIEELRENATSLRDRAIIETLNTTGLRVSELCGLDISQVIDCSAVICGKGNKERTVYFSKSAWHTVEKYLKTRHDNNPALFINMRKTNGVYERISKGTVENSIRKLGEKSNIKAHPHKFRRTVASRAANKGMPIQEIQALFGHSKIDTTIRYCSVNQENIKMSHEKFIC